MEIGNIVKIWWNGLNTVYIDAHPNLRGKTQGLCGTFTDNQKDDFLTTEGDIEQSPQAFGNKWRIDEVNSRS